MTHFDSPRPAEGARVWIWDPNPFNAYGMEVARVVARSASRVRVSVRANSALHADGVKSWRVLPPPADGQHSFSHRVQYAVGVLRFFVAAIFVRPIVVITWSNTAVEMLAIRFLQILRVRSIVVIHNPMPAREVVVERSMLYKIRKGATRLVVHSERLADISGLKPRPCVAAHPAYFSWASAMRSMANHALDPFAGSDGAVGLYLGALRRDKGVDLLPALDLSLSRRGGQLALCVGKADSHAAAILERCSTAIRVSDGGGYVSDFQIFECLSYADALVAPYSDVTASGTAIIAISLGTRVVTFANESMADLLGTGDLAPAGDVDRLAELVVAGRANPLRRKELVDVAQRLDDESAAGWQSILAGIQIL